MNGSAQDHRFSLFPVICSQLPVTNSNLFLSPLKVRVIGSRLMSVLFESPTMQVFLFSVD